MNTLWHGDNLDGGKKEGLDVSPLPEEVLLRALRQLFTALVRVYSTISLRSV
jgi:hypothetical protein